VKLEELLRGGMDSMTDEDLLARIRERRFNVNRAKPAAAVRKERATAQGANRNLNDLARKMGALPPDELRKLLADLEENANG
jgi:hypothetical protein